MNQFRNRNIEEKKFGSLTYNAETDRFFIRYDLEDSSHDFHCGEYLEIYTQGQWVPTNIEYYHDGFGWYLTRFGRIRIEGLLARL